MTKRQYKKLKIGDKFECRGKVWTVDGLYFTKWWQLRRYGFVSANIKGTAGAIDHLGTFDMGAAPSMRLVA